ncbi:acyltransferase [Roseateles sp. SL47]|uniref:acyltransferase family protein n=1 Tax=Roseateles sp. SL47 TaxID=2995138 RepID=UPI00226FB795|nr:acyltransferase [Roseateles sp. SL47]WAC74140.1 acyltransferase [Roseateles sp. SL47]
MNRLPGLDLLRALAVTWVMLFHSFLVGGLGDDFAWLSRFGWAGVDMFFVLSGFLIGTQWLKPLAAGEAPRFRAFYARRAWRVLPAFLVVLAVYVAFPAWREAPGLQPWWQFATFTVNLLIDYARHPAFSHAWSLCVEEHFYLLFPLLAWGLARRRSVVLTVSLCAGLAMAGVALRTGIWLHDDATSPDRAWYVEDLYYPTWTRLDGLLAGVVLALIKVYRPQHWARLMARPAAALLLGVTLITAALWLFRDRTGLPANAVGWPLLSAGMAGLLVAAASPRSGIGRWSLPSVGWVATLSYSLYLSHKLVMHAVDQALPTSVNGGWRFVAHGVAILAGGAALHYLVERPGLKYRDRTSAATATATATASAGATARSARSAA